MASRSALLAVEEDPCGVVVVLWKGYGDWAESRKPRVRGNGGA